MLSIEIRVNGQPVCVVAGHRGRLVNGSAIFPDGDTEFEYPWAGFSTFSEGRDMRHFNSAGTVTHRYADGMATLCSKILSQISVHEMKARKTSNAKKPRVSASTAALAF